MGTEGTHLYGDRAPHNLQYVVLVASANLTQERVLTGTANQITITDNGAGSTVVLSTPQNIHTGASPTFADVFVPDGGTFGITGNELLTFNAAGYVTFSGCNVGIGTATPTELLHIAGTGAQRLRVEDITAVEHIDIGIQAADGPGFISRFGTGGDDILIYANGDVELGKFGKVGIGVTDPHSLLEVAGAISSATTTIDASSDAFDVTGVNAVFIDTSGGNVVIGGFANGVAGQVIYLTMEDITHACTLEHQEATGTQKFYLCDDSDETLSDHGGWVLVCDGTSWYDCGHAKHVA